MYANEAGPDPDDVLGGQMASELASRGYNPWDTRAVAQQYSRDLNLPPEANIHFAQTQPGATDEVGHFSAPVRGKDGTLAGPFNPQYSNVSVASDLSDFQRILATRHELEHAKDYYQKLNHGGYSEALSAGPEHFTGGGVEEVQRGFVARPWMSPR